METLLLAPVSGATLGGRVSIDSNTTNDNGFLANARNNNPQAGRHGSSQEASNNLSSGDQSKVLVGHGDSGIIVAGTGQIASDPAKYISNSNFSQWRPMFAALKGKCSNLRLWSCHTGSRQAGADLLSDLAETIGCPVQGYSGFVYDNSAGQFTTEPGGTWVTATPGHKPSPVNPPTTYFDLKFNSLELVGGAQMSTIDAGHVTSISIISTQSTAVASGAIHTITGDAAKNLFARIGISPPLTLPGVPSGIITAKFSIRTDDGAEKTFVVLSNRMLQDDSSPPIYYYCSADIASILLSAF